MDFPIVVGPDGQVGIPAYVVRSLLTKAKSWPEPTDSRTFTDPGHGLCYQAEYLGRMYNRTKTPEIKKQIGAVLHTLLQLQRKP